MVDFAGWDMPLHYGSQVDEHHAVRQNCGLFDVSHMCAVDVAGAQATDFLRHLLANDVAKIDAGRAMYSCMLNPEAGVVDDLIVYRLGEQSYRIVVNAGTAEKDLAWMQSQLSAFTAEVRQRRDLGVLALQGPHAADVLASAGLPAQLTAAAQALKPFRCVAADERLLGRTGYTGEDGFEMVLPLAELPAVWEALTQAGVQPCGLGCRDTLRLEAGMALYGQDMDDSVNPLIAGLGWTIAWEPAERDFVGREALAAVRAEDNRHRMVGLLLEGRGVLRAHQAVHAEAGVGEITSGGFSPTLQRSIALARVPAGTSGTVEVEIRNKRVPARVVKYPFVRHGQAQIEL